MKTPSIDPIMAEVHAVKDALSQQFKHDVIALCSHLQEMDSPVVQKAKVKPSYRPAKRPSRSPALAP
jgi:hypothetical protein